MRGLCEADLATLTFLEKVSLPSPLSPFPSPYPHLPPLPSLPSRPQHDVSWKVILTKCDHLSAEEVAKSVMVVYNDLLALKRSLKPPPDNVDKPPPHRPPKSGPRKGGPPAPVAATSDSESASDEESEEEGSISIQELMMNGYNLPTKEKPVDQPPAALKRRLEPEAPPPSVEDIIGEDGIVYPGSASASAAPPVIAYADEDDFNEEALDHSIGQQRGSGGAAALASKSPSVPPSHSSPLVITEDGEIVGGYHINYNDLSPKNYALLMRDAKRQMDKLRLIRDQEIAEKGSVDYELIDINDEDLLAGDEGSGDEGEEEGQGQGGAEADEECDVDGSLAEVLKYVVPVSATTGAGINRMWEDIRQCVIATVSHPSGWEGRAELSEERRKELVRMVREHQGAAQERKRIAEAAAAGAARARAMAGRGHKG
jgi:hypothetical protein